MKIKQLIIAALLGLVTSLASVQTAGAAVNFVFTLPNTLTPTSGITVGPNGSFTFDIRLNYPSTPPTDAKALSYWFEVPNAVASVITITSQTITNTANGATPWSINLAPGTDFPMAFNTAADSGFMRDNAFDSGGDLGGSNPGTTAGVAPSASTYYVSTLTFQLNNAPTGSFNLQTTLSPPSSVSPQTGSFTALPQAIFTVTVIPEPATWSLLGLGGLGAVGLNLLRARRRS